MTKKQGRWNTRTWRTRSRDALLSRDSTPTLRARLQDLRVEETALCVSISKELEPSSEVRAALVRLGSHTTNALRTLEGDAVYRQWVSALRSRIAKVELRVHKSAPPELLSKLLYALIVAPAAKRKLSEANLEYEKQRARLDNLYRIESDSASVAAMIELVDPYVKTLAQRDADRVRLRQVQQLISDHESILAKRTDRSRTAIPTEVKQAVWKRDGGVCVRCGRGKADGARLHFDHIIPYSLGGSDTEENVQVLCLDCNLKKGANIE